MIRCDRPTVGVVGDLTAVYEFPNPVGAAEIQDPAGYTAFLLCVGQTPPEDRSYVGRARDFTFRPGTRDEYRTSPVLLHERSCQIIEVDSSTVGLFGGFAESEQTMFH